MICRFLRGYRRVREDIEGTQAVLDEVRSQRVEVAEKARWAREKRQQNHLTEIFYRSIVGGEHRG